MLKCNTCLLSKPVSDFHKNPKTKRGYHYYCKSCGAARQRARRHTEPEAVQAWYLKNRYNLTKKEYDNMLIDQDYKCAICKTDVDDLPQTSRASSILHVDHDHDTGKVRGLLCYNCNHGLGKFRDNPEYLRSAIDYLIDFD